MEKQNTISLSLTEEEINKLQETFKENISSKTPAYARFQLRLENCVVTVYESKKVVFQGSDASIYASPFTSLETPTPKKTVELIYPQAGSDEVGTGDYFGPVCVCASYVKKEDLELIHSLGVRDSKALKDEDIRKVAPILEEKIIHSTLIVLPEKYNQVHEKYNMNAIKALLHNQAYINLSKKIELPSFMIIDQFAEKSLYYHYLAKEKDVVRDIHFETKAEDKYPSVAVSSVIARNAFLTTMDKLEEKYDMKFQKGGSQLADECAKEFVKKYGFDHLPYVAKMHFKNTERL